MCGRFVLDTHPELVEFYFELDHPVPDFKPSWNIPPGSDVPVIWQLPDNGRACSLMHWGLIPHWARSSSSKYKMINAKAETLQEKPAFRDAFKKRRCLIPTSGFYEWHATSRGKQPYYIGMADKGLFAFAGLWEYWEGPETIHSFTIITTPANRLISDIHERMPVIIPPANFNRWLDPANQLPSSLKGLLEPKDATGLDLYPVSTLVNSPRNDSPQCMQAISH